MDSSTNAKRQSFAQLRSQSKEIATEPARLFLPGLNSPKQHTTNRPYSRDISYMKDRRMNFKGTLQVAEEQLFSTLSSHLKPLERKCSIKVVSVKDAPSLRIEHQFYEVLRELTTANVTSDEGLHAYARYTETVKSALEALYKKTHEGPVLSHSEYKFIKPTGRREAELLANWLVNLMKFYINDCEFPVSQQIHTAELILKTALGELMRQVTVQCIERGELLGKIVRAMGIVANMTAARDKLELTELEGNIEKLNQQNAENLSEIKAKYKAKVRTLKKCLELKNRELEELRGNTQEYLNDLNLYRKRVSALQVELEGHNRAILSSLPEPVEQPIVLKRHTATLTEAKDFKTKYRGLYSAPVGRPVLLVGYFEDQNTFQKLAAYVSNSDQTQVLPYDFPVHLLNVPRKADAETETISHLEEFKGKAYAELTTNLYKEIELEDIEDYGKIVPFTVVSNIFFAETKNNQVDAQVQVLQQRRKLDTLNQFSVDITPLEKQSKEKHKKIITEKDTEPTHTQLIPETTEKHTESLHTYFIPATPHKKQVISHSLSVPTSRLRGHSGPLSNRTLSLPRVRTPLTSIGESQELNTSNSCSVSYIQSICAEDRISQLISLKKMILAQNIQFKPEILDSQYRPYPTMNEWPASASTTMSSLNSENVKKTNDKAVQVNLTRSRPTAFHRTQTTVNSKVDNVSRAPNRILLRLRTDTRDLNSNRQPVTAKQGNSASLFVKNYLAYLSSTIIFHNPITVRQLMRIINKVYADKLSARREGTKGEAFQASAVLYNVLLNQYGLRNVAEQKLRHIVLGCLAYSEQYKRVSNFERFIGVNEGFSLESWNFFCMFLERTLCELSGSILLNKETSVNHFIVYQRAIGFIETFFRGKLPANEYDELVARTLALKEDDGTLCFSKNTAIEKIDSDELFCLISEYYDRLKEKAYGQILGLTSQDWDRKQSVSLPDFRKILLALKPVKEPLIEWHFSAHINSASNSMSFESVLSFVVENSLLN